MIGSFRGVRDELLRDGDGVFYVVDAGYDLLAWQRHNVLGQVVDEPVGALEDLAGVDDKLGRDMPKVSDPVLEPADRVLDVVNDAFLDLVQVAGDLRAEPRDPPDRRRCDLKERLYELRREQ